jgi:hypothetical protein
VSLAFQLLPVVLGQIKWTTPGRCMTIWMVQHSEYVQQVLALLSLGMQTLGPHGLRLLT